MLDGEPSAAASELLWREFMTFAREDVAEELGVLVVRCSGHFHR